MSHDLLDREAGLRAARAPFVLATVVRAERPTSAKPGDRALVLADGTIEGFVGGTCAESTVRVQGLRLLSVPAPQDAPATLLRITPDEAAEEVRPGMVTVGNPCLSGGSLEIFLEAVVPPVLVQVFGQAPIARALVGVGAAVGYEMRESLDPNAAISADTTAVVVASHGRDEEPVLTAALRANVPYIALVASPRRGAAVLSSLSSAQSARVRTPAGLDLGAGTPGEVAISILAQLIQERPAPAVATRPASAVVKDTAIDPVCGMSVAVSPGSLHLDHDGGTVYFCGPGCKQAFADEPDRYLGGR